MQLHLRSKEQKNLVSVVIYKKMKTTPKRLSMNVNTDDKAGIQ